MKKLFIINVLFYFIIIFSSGLNAKILRMALDSDPVSMDLHVQLSGGMLQYSHWVADPLVRYKNDMTLEARLAKSWKRIDDLTMRFYLRKDVLFHSGNNFTSKDVKFTFDRIKKSIDYKGLFEPFEKCLIIDKYTVDFKTKRPYFLLMKMMSYIFPLDSVFYTGLDKQGKRKDRITKTDSSFAGRNFTSTTGPYKVTKREHGIIMVLERNKNYWDKSSSGNVQKIILRPIKKNATRVAALLSGDVNLISPVPPQDFSRVNRNSKVKLVTHLGTRLILFQMNQKRNVALANKYVRQAINYAINNVGISKKLMKGTATPAGQISPKGFAGHDSSLKPVFDLDYAKKLMKKAGLKNGFSATMIAPNNRYVNDQIIAEAVCTMLKKIGIKVSLKTMPKAQYWDAYDKQDADFQLIGWHPDTEDSGNYYEYLTMCKDSKTGFGAYNTSNYCNKEADKLIVSAQSEIDQKKRKEMLKKVERMISSESVIIPLHWQNHSYAASNNVDIKPIINVMNHPYLGDLIIK